LIDAKKGVTDIPPAIFAQELMDAYPSAKIILTVRDEEKWFESMKATLWHAGRKNVGSPTVLLIAFTAIYKASSL